MTEKKLAWHSPQQIYKNSWKKTFAAPVMNAYCVAAFTLSLHLHKAVDKMLPRNNRAAQ